MSNAAEGNTPPAAETKTPEPAPAREPAQPKVDVAAIEAAAEKKAAEIADKKLKSAFKALAGEEEKPKLSPVMESFVDDPVGVLRAVKDAAVKQAREEISNETKLEREMTAAAQPILDKYPDLNEHLDYVDAKIRSHLQAGLSVREATVKGLEDVSKKLGLKSVDEIAEDRRLRGAGIPPMGAQSRGSGKDAQAFDPEKSTADFIKGYKDKVKSFKVRK